MAFWYSRRCRPLFWIKVLNLFSHVWYAYTATVWLICSISFFLSFFLFFFGILKKRERQSTKKKKKRSGLELNLQCWLNRVVAFVLSKRSDRSGFRTHLVIADQLPDWFFFFFFFFFSQDASNHSVLLIFVFFAFPTYNSITTRPSGNTKAFTTF